MGPLGWKKGHSNTEIMYEWGYADMDGEFHIM